ncbi:hypothetical protein C8R46DRAFT_1040668 [Mycena filopes]|nr:hypothetical protein C8R46DRAFT_1040668 [Mycena filopes]
MNELRGIRMLGLLMTVMWWWFQAHLNHEKVEKANSLTVDAALKLQNVNSRRYVFAPGDDEIEQVREVRSNLDSILNFISVFFKTRTSSTLEFRRRLAQRSKHGWGAGLRCPQRLGNILPYNTNSDGALTGNDTRKLERGAEDLLAAARHDGGKKAHARRLVGGKEARGVGELGQEGVVP